jgi:hypothetical protein
MGSGYRRLAALLARRGLGRAPVDDHQAMVIWLFPYLPLADRLTVGPWTLIPRASLEDADATSAEVAEQARGVAALYRLAGDSRGFEAFLRGEQPVGEELDDDAHSRLYQTVVTALLDVNASQAGGDYDEHNSGHRICTTENALLFGHGVDPDGYTAYSYGSMVQTLVGGPRVGELVDVIDPGGCTYSIFLQIDRIRYPAEFCAPHG